MSNTNIISILQSEIKRRNRIIKELQRELNGMKIILDERETELTKEKLKNAS